MSRAEMTLETEGW